MALLGPRTTDATPFATPPRWSPMRFLLTPPPSPRRPAVPARQLVVSWYASFEHTMQAATEAGATAVGIDMPIGLPTDGRRRADGEARALLGARRATLFPTPARSVLDASDYTDALVRSRRATGKGLSRQAWNLVPKIAEVDRWMTAERQERTFEVHPELAFARLAGEVLSEPKRSPAGSARRLAVLDQSLGLGAEQLDRLITARPGPGVARDDVLDAIAVAVSCRLLAAGEGAVLGGGERDGRGLPMRICY